MKLIIPGQPKSQKRHRTARSGHRYDPSSKDKKVIRRHALQIKPPKPIKDLLRVEVDAYFQTPTSWSDAKIERHEGRRRGKTPDVDNIEKIIFDALNKMIWQDDKQIVESKVRKFYSNTPRTEITIIQLPAHEKNLLG